MSYRDELEALRAEVGVLRRENEEYRAALAEAGADKSVELVALREKLTLLEGQLKDQLCNQCQRRIEIENTRVPCPNEICVGVVHLDGVCGTCGVKVEPYEELRAQYDRATEYCTLLEEELECLRAELADHALSMERSHE